MGMNFHAELKVLLTVIMIVPLIEFHFHCLHHSAILSGNMASEQAAIALLFLSLLCFCFVFCCPTSVSSLLIQLHYISPLIFVVLASCCHYKLCIYLIDAM